MNEDSVKVYTNETLCGDLAFEHDQYVFTYNDTAPSVVSLRMPIRKSSWNAKRLHPIFEMNMPEGALREAIKNHFAKIQNMDDINFLKLIGPYMLGRVKFNELIDTDEKLKLDDILKNHKDNLFEELMQKFAIRSGVSGVQPKLLLTAHNKTTMRFEHYIVKSWENAYPQLALNEYFCMSAIKNAHLPTPDFYLSDDLSMFVMKRFDVQEDNAYLGFEDMCVLTARATDEKYYGSYEEIVRVIKDIISPTKRKESLHIFFTALVMNHLLRNGDAHLKNYGVLYERDYEDARLAPIYDVITTTIYIKNDIPALKMGDGKLWWKEKTFKTFATKSCGLSNKEYDAIVQTCCEAVITTKKAMDRYACSSTEVKNFLEALKGCWQEHL
ncbi:MAG: type II toxin-antitoxin system HipA family toxin [Sulfuricurvum sp.]